MKNLLKILVVFVIIFEAVSCCVAANNIQTNRVVVTFSPLVINNINCTARLFEVISKTVEGHKDLSDKLEASGALWAISQNHCGIQICISSPKTLEELYQLVDFFLTTASKDVENIFNYNNQNIKPLDRLYQFIVESNASTSKPVSIRFYDSSGNEIENYYSNKFVKNEINIYSDSSDSNNDLSDSEENSNLSLKENDFIKNYQSFYERAYKNNQINPKVQNVSKPILANILGWKKLTPETFISATLIKNRFITEDPNNKSFKIELFYTNNGLFLVICCDVDQVDKLYDTYLNMCKKIDSALSDISSKEWATWAAKLVEVMKNDKRDYNKKAMFESWYKHWSGIGFDNISSAKLELRKPDYTKEIQIFSSPSEHIFNLSSDVFPSIYACHDENFTDGANVAVCIKGHRTILDSIENHITTSLHLKVPITINQKQEDNILISFYCPNEKIPAFVSRIKASIANHLYSKFNITDLKKSVRIGVAGISSIPAYQLNGLLTLGWPTKSGRYKSEPAQEADLYAFVKSSNSTNDKNFKLRWESMTSSPQDKAIVLAMLACYNLTIDSWKRE